MANLPILNYTTPEEFVDYYYNKLKTDLSIFDLQISKVGFVGFFLNLLGYTHFDLKQYYDSLFKEAFVGTAQTEESQYIHASTYGYIPTFAIASTATGTIEFDMINWLPRRQTGVIRREVIVGYNSSGGTYVPLSSTFKVDDFQFTIDAIYKFVEIEDNGSYYYYVDITTSDGTKINTPSTSSTVSAPLYSTSQYNKKEVTFELKPYNFGSFQTYYFGISAGYYLSDLEVYVTEVGSVVEEQYDVKYTKYLEKGSSTSVFLRKVTSTNYVIEFGSGLRGKWVSGANIRLVIKSTRGTSGNLIDKTNLKLQIAGTVLAFDYIYSTGGQLSQNSNPTILQQPLVDFDYSESGLDPLSGEDLRDAIVNYIQTRDNMISQQDFYNIADEYLDDFKFIFKKFNVFDNVFHLCRSFRDRNQTILYTTNHTEQVMDLQATAALSYAITAAAGLTGSGTLASNTYGYFVVAVDEWGQSVPSAIVTDTVTTPGEDSVTITWDHVDYATKYRVYGRYPTFRDQYWEVAASYPQPATYSYIDDGTAGTLHIEPISYELQEIYYRPPFTINSEAFISPFIYKGNTRMNYYDGYLMKNPFRVEFAEITPEVSILGTGFDVPMVYLSLEYIESKSSIVTISNGSPAVVTWAAHGLVYNTPVVFSTLGALPTGITAGTVYYVMLTGLTTNTFQISASPRSLIAVNTSSAGSGTHTCISQYRTIVKLKSYQTISNLVFTISIYGESDIADKRMVCFPLTNNYFEYEYSNADTFGIFDGEIQIEVKGGTSDSIVTDKIENYTIGAGTKTLKIKFNDSSTEYLDAFTTVTLTTGSVTAATLVSDINIAIGLTVASVYVDDDGNNRIKITPPTGGTVTNVFIGDVAAGSTCLSVLGLTGNTISVPAVLNGPLLTTKFTCKTDDFYQLVDLSDQLKLTRYNSGANAYIVNIPIIYDSTFDSDPDYYLDKIKNFIVTSTFNENRMVTDNVQCRFLNSYLIESPFIESIFLQSGTIFSNSDYTWLDPVIDTRDLPPTLALNGSRYRVSTTPTGGSYFAGHANQIAIYDTSIAAPYWVFDAPTTDEFVLDSETNIYYRWSGTAWVDIPDIVLPLNMRIEIKADKSYIQRNNIDIATEKENLTLAVTEYLQKGFTGSSIIFYNSLIVEFVHKGRLFIKSVRVYVTDSSTVPNEMDNGVEVKTDNDILRGLKNKLDIVKYVPPMIYWDVDNIDIVIYVE